jgi:hypothetical protein
VLRLRDRPHTKGDRSHLVFLSAIRSSARSFTAGVQFCTLPASGNRSYPPHVFLLISDCKEAIAMPYGNDAELPDSLKDNLPNHAQDIYREVFNSAWEEYKDASKRRGKMSPTR